MRSTTSFWLRSEGAYGWEISLQASGAKCLHAGHRLGVLHGLRREGQWLLGNSKHVHRLGVLFALFLLHGGVYLWSLAAGTVLLLVSQSIPQQKLGSLLTRFSIK